LHDGAGALRLAIDSGPAWSLRGRPACQLAQFAPARGCSLRHNHRLTRSQLRPTITSLVAWRGGDAFIGTQDPTRCGAAPRHGPNHLDRASASYSCRHYSSRHYSSRHCSSRHHSRRHTCRLRRATPTKFQSDDCRRPFAKQRCRNGAFSRRLPAARVAITEERVWNALVDAVRRAPESPAIALPAPI